MGALFEPNHSFLVLKHLPIEFGDLFEIHVHLKVKYKEFRDQKEADEPEEGPKRGRPPKFKKHDNFSTKMLLVWYHNHHRMPLSGAYFSAINVKYLYIRR